MAFQKKSTSNAVKTAKVRISGMKSINANLNFGDDLSLEAYEAALQDTEAKIAAYNTALAEIGQLQAAARAAERTLSERSERMLNLVAGRYGKRSNEYEQAGGKKRGSTPRKPRAKQLNPDLLATA